MRTTEMRRAGQFLQRGGWLEAGGVASLIFLTVLAAGAALLLAGKLQFPSLGTGSDPLDVLRAIGLVGLATLGGTIDIDGLPLSVIPLGALALIALSSVHLTRDAFRARERWGVMDALKVGAVLAIICALGGLVFRFGGTVPVAVSPIEVAALGFIWGSLIAGIGAALASDPGAGASLRRLPDGPVGDGIRTGLLMLRRAALGSVTALLIFVIGRLLAGPLPRSFGVGDTIAALLYLIAFLPNVLVAVFSLSVGATLTVGAQVDVGGSVVGPLQERSLFEWGGGGTPPGLVLLLLLPLTVSVLGGMWAARRESRPSALAITLAIAALGFSLAVGGLASLGDARLGAGLVKEQGVGLVAVDGLQAAILTLLWITLGGGLGAAIQRQLQARTTARTA